MESKRAATSGSGTLLPARLLGATDSRGSRWGSRGPSGGESGTLRTLREGMWQLRLAPPMQRAALESTREDDLRFGREHVRDLLDTVQSPLEMACVSGSHLKQIVGLAGQVMALFDLVDLAEIGREVGGDRTRNLLDEDERQHPVAERSRIGEGDIALDDPARLELLDPLVGRRSTHPDRLPDIGEGLAAIPLQEVQDSSVGLVDSFQSAHIRRVLRLYEPVLPVGGRRAGISPRPPVPRGSLCACECPRGLHLQWRRLRS